MKTGVWTGAQCRPSGSRETGQQGSRRNFSIAPPEAGQGTDSGEQHDQLLREGSMPHGRDTCDAVHESLVRECGRAHLFQFAGWLSAQRIDARDDIYALHGFLVREIHHMTRALENCEYRRR